MGNCSSADGVQALQQEQNGKKGTSVRPKQGDRTLDVFISYQHNKKEQVERLFNVVSQTYTCWIDKYSLKPGETLESGMTRGIQGCKVMLACITNSYINSQACRYEISTAKLYQKPIIPLMLERGVDWPPRSDDNSERSMYNVFKDVKYINFCKPTEDIQNDWPTCPGFGELMCTISELVRTPSDRSVEPTESKETPGSSTETSKLNVVSAGEGAVVGIAVVGNELFALRSPCDQRLEVYNAETGALQRYMRLTSPKNVAALTKFCWSMAACGVNKCLYIGNERNVHRIEMKNESKHTVWPLLGANAAFGLSSNAQGTLIFSGTKILEFEEVGYLAEYSTRGSLIRQIDLPDVRPYCALKLPTGRWLVSDRPENQCSIRIDDDAPPHRVCLLNDDGGILRSYGTSPGSGDGRLDEPVGLAVVRYHGDDFEICVADKDNNRIVMLTSDLCWSRDLNENGVRLPRTLCVDQLRGRLYVGESREKYDKSSECRVLALNLKAILANVDCL